MRKWNRFSKSSWIFLLIVCVTLVQLLTWLERARWLIWSFIPAPGLTLTPGPWQRSSSSVCGSPITLSQSLNLSKQLKSPLFIDPEWTSRARVAGQYCLLPNAAFTCLLKPLFNEKSLGNWRRSLLNVQPMLKTFLVQSQNFFPNSELVPLHSFDHNSLFFSKLCLWEWYQAI